MLQALTPNSKQAAKAMDARPPPTTRRATSSACRVAEQLHDRLAGLSEEQRNATLATIFGNDAVRAAAVLYKEGAGRREWTKNVNDAGYAPGRPRSTRTTCAATWRSSAAPSTRR
jgi:hypothetical protein